MVNEIEAMDIFLINNINIYKMFGKYLILIHLKVLYNHYLKKDILLLLAGLIEKIFFMCLKHYGLDPCHYFNAPGLSWDVMLKITKKKKNK